MRFFFTPTTGGYIVTEYDQLIRYRGDPILIDTSRVLESTLPSMTVALSGGQAEILRNLCQYAELPATFVSSYETVGYTTPSESEWDELQAVVADLERRLMGNENTPLGIYERVADTHSETATAGTNAIVAATVPAGFFYTLSHLAFANTTTVCTVQVEIHTTSKTLVFFPVTSIPVNTYVPLPMRNMVLAEGDYVRFVFLGCVAGDTLKAQVWGYSTALSV
jgi:hypothetical protein